MHGVQITPTALVRPANVPPFGSWFVDFDGYFEDPEVEAHVGDVEVWQPCEGRAGYYEQIPGGGYLPPFYPPDFPPRWRACRAKATNSTTAESGAQQHI